LGNALQKKGKLDEAVAAFSKAVQLKPNFPEAHYNLGNALKQKQRLDEAITAYSKAIQLKPDLAVIHFSLGEVLAAKCRLDEALAAHDRAIQLKPDWIEAWNGRGSALMKLSRFDEAVAAHRRALALNPNLAATHLALGSAQMDSHDVPGAMESFRHAVALDPESAEAWYSLGTTMKALGQFDEASAYYRRALAIQPDMALAFAALAVTGKQAANTVELERLENLLNQVDLPREDRIAAGFALGKLLDDADRFDQAFTRYAEANSLVKQSQIAAGEHFDRETYHRYCDEIIARFIPRFFSETRSWGEPSDVPVFIVGMPRSGTTLVEQIAASHPAVFGAGELDSFSRIAATLGETEKGTTSRQWDAREVKRLAQTYIGHVQSLAGQAMRITDKAPGNLINLGLIATLFPTARVILCRRDPRDNCLSCFFQWFRTGHAFSYDLADCGRQYLEAKRVAAYWRDVLPLKILEVQYETLVADLEGQSRRLIDFLGLPWDPACLEFHRTQRVVLTASDWQVRQPLYTRSVGRWRNYQRHLGPLLEVLDEKEN
jgi:tetratricopeptide (TPR) repeat protein